MTATTVPAGWVYDDGGRRAAGYIGDAGDCVARAIAIALEAPYADVYADLAALAARHGRPRSARNGVPRRVYDAYLTAAGWEWTPTMAIGAGCTVHLDPDELPAGRLITRLSGHMAAVVDGVVHDTDDPRRGGRRCVYGYWANPR